MRYTRIVVGIALLATAAGGILLWQRKQPSSSVMPAVTSLMTGKRAPTPTPAVPIAEPGPAASVTLPVHVYQTFNNCGPATLSMILAYGGIRAGQEELADKMRPYRNPEGDNDDKTVMPAEFVYWAETYGVYAVARPDGTVPLLKTFLANGIPVVVKTVLKSDDDIGHFRIIKAYDDRSGTVVQDDSFQGPNLTYTYADLEQIWQPFNYQYMIVVPEKKAALVQAILGQAADEQTAWQDAATRARRELKADPASVYAGFNLATSLFHLGDYQGSVTAYQSVASRLPRRMLWYQIEPIRAYLKLKDYAKVFAITDAILNDGNRAFSELYYLRGQAYLAEGKSVEAEAEFAKAELYHPGFDPSIPGL